MSDTPYGFTWGPAVIERRATLKRSDGDYRVLGVKTPDRDLDIYISPQGRSVRVFSGGREFKPTGGNP